MTSLPFIDGEELDRLLPMSDAIDALDSMFGADAQPEAPTRQHLSVSNGDLLLMPAWDPSAIGVKLVTITPANRDLGLPLISGVYVLFSSATGEPVMLVDAAPLTRLRTAAVSGVATRHLARDDPSDLVVFGSGVQAEAHVEAMRAVRAIRTVTIVGRSIDSAQDLAYRAGAIVGDAEAVTDADIICTCTTSATPLFDGIRVKPGTHVNAVGSYRRDARELDDVLMARATVVIDTPTALSESGDLLMPISAGAIDTDQVVELTQIVRGEPTRGSDITVFKSVGVASEDLAVASAVLARMNA